MIYYTLAFHESFRKSLNNAPIVDTSEFNVHLHSADTLQDIHSQLNDISDLNGYALISAHHPQKIGKDTDYIVVSEKKQRMPQYKEFPTRTNKDMTVSPQALFMIDLDHKLGIPHTSPTEYREQLVHILRQQGVTCDLIVRPSSSHSQETYYKLHIIGVLGQTDKRQIKQFNTNLNKLLVQNGYGQGKVDKRGTITVESIDHALAVTVQLLFLGHKHEDVFTPVFVQGSTREQYLASLSIPDEMLYAKQVDTIKEQLKSKSELAKAEYITATAKRLDVSVKDAAEHVAKQAEGTQLVALTNTFTIKDLPGTVTTLDILWDKFTKANRYDGVYAKWEFTEGSEGYRAKLNYDSAGLFNVFTFHFGGQDNTILLAIPDEVSAIEDITKQLVDYAVRNHAGKHKAEFPIKVLNMIGISPEDMEIAKEMIKKDSGMSTSLINNIIKKHKKEQSNKHATPNNEILDINKALTIEHIYQLPDLKATNMGLVIKTTSSNLRVILETYGLTIQEDVIKDNIVIPGLIKSPYEINAQSTSRYKLDNLMQLNDIQAGTKLDAAIATLIYDTPDAKVNYVTRLFEATQCDKGRDYVGELLQKIEIRENTPHTRKRFERAMRLWFIQCVAAADAAERTPNKDARPKFEMMPILTGGQGVKKSDIIPSITPKALHGYLNSINEFDPTSKDSKMQIGPNWLIEVSEVQSTLNSGRNAQANFKAFQSAFFLEYRPPYGRNMVTKPRRFSLLGTDNNTTSVLKDRTGNRRTPTFEVLSIDNMNKLTEEFKEEMWSQVWDQYLAGNRWWFTHEEEVELEQENAYFISEDALMSAVVNTLRDMAKNIYAAGISTDGYFYTNASELALGIHDEVKRGTTPQGIVTKIGNVMKKLGYTPEKYSANKTRYKITKESLRMPYEITAEQINNPEL